MHLLAAGFCPAISSWYCLKFVNMCRSPQGPEKMLRASKGRGRVSAQTQVREPVSQAVTEMFPLTIHS